jgi:hypothetical protein
MSNKRSWIGALANISANLDREVKKDRITADERTSALERIKTCVTRGPIGQLRFRGGSWRQKSLKLRQNCSANSIRSAAQTQFFPPHIFDFDHETWAATKRPDKVLACTSSIQCR